jgi:hypothetical protein
MTHYKNVPPEQREVQRLIDQWNADEALWRRLARRRRARRHVLSELSEAELRELDLREHAAQRPPDSCIGRPLSRGAR